MRWVVIFFLAVGVFGALVLWLKLSRTEEDLDLETTVQTTTPSPTVTPTPTVTPSPTPKPLTFAEMNKLFGPCVSMPILMYHHVEDLETAKKAGHASLTVSIEYFMKHMEYLTSKGYTTVTPADLINFFDNGVALPAKPVMLTFDDGYADNGEEMYQLMLAAKTKGTVFIPTGLMNNPGYLSWEKVREMAGSGLFSFGNHTWSHRNVGGDLKVVEYEVTTADTQLTEQGLNNPKTFVYPYGIETGKAVQLLKDKGYKLAFTTVYGRTQCEKKRFDLPRIRVGNAPLSSYGL
jgi:peptidoglycan/xylan/chitin deacetylase (PgdA/CDA1 family)